ncbi:MAG: aminotransferase class III-fold pyridoxal phosphate-dependent enzyme, partial [Trueperaceae bacterium]|nr:aminotransferase class III-fold pyridoxal phosphate-dependent enzyme [Trueperaceae bacterium]
WKVLEDGTDEFGAIGHGWTYSAHPIGAAAGVANLALIDDLDLIGNVRRVGPVLQAGLREALGGHANVGDIRGEGLLLAVEFVEDREARRFFDSARKVGPQVAAAMLRRGVIARAIADTLALCPPMIISEAEIEELFAPMEAALDATHAWARKEGHL